MASKFECRFGAVIRKNLYEGRGLRLRVHEELTDVAANSRNVGILLDRIVAQWPVVATCSQCARLAIIDDAGGKISFYTSVP
ncbi:hypothetical protein OKW46_000106 [Paraburkholderia sp. WSM4179]|nr:hypothetical protein [Paraburkholderia sp. WSM4179]MDH6146184.1 hypothetical protein [Paraburkholderia sp. WSM4179]